MRTTLSALALAFVVAMPAAAQSSPRTIGPVCFGCRRAIGLRLNFRDRDLDQVTGINITVWSPVRPTTGTVNGLALGVLATGAAYLNGITLAPLAFNASTHVQGLAASTFFGVGGEVKGIVVSGLGGGIGEGLTGAAVTAGGIGVGGDVDGIVIAGLGGGIRGNLRGLAGAGIGFGISGSGQGILMTGLGAAVAGSMTGISVAGIGFGGGGSMRGITIAGMGAGIGGNTAGITVATLGAGIGGTASGLTVSALGVAAVHLRTAAVATTVFSSDAKAVVIAPLMFRTLKRNGLDGDATGLFVSTINSVGGMQHGVSIGVINYARALGGLQLGVLNIVADGKGPKVLPIANWR